MTRFVRLRRFSSLVCGGLTLAALLGACGGPEIALNGTVTNLYTGQPISDATVHIGSSELTTDANGKFQVQRWSREDTLNIDAKGYEPAAVHLADKPQLAKPQPPAMSIDAVPLRPNTLSGTVTDAYTGKPIAGAQAHVTDAISATTDTTGHYLLTNVPETFPLTIVAPDHAQFSENIQRQTSRDVMLRPNVLSGTVTNKRSGEPVAGATVKAGDATATTNAQGVYQLTNVPENATVQISADGYSTVQQPLGKTLTLDAALRASTITGKLVNSETGEPVKFATIVAQPASDANESDVAEAKVENSADGSFSLKNVPEQGTLFVLAPGYKKATVELKNGVALNEIKLEPFTAKGVYVTVAVASQQDWLNDFFDLIDSSKLNTIVIDLKSDQRDDLGLVYYDSQTPMVKELHTSADVIDFKQVLAEAKKRGIYTIARIQLFSHDNALADAKPDVAVKVRSTGEIYADEPGPGIRYVYLDPWNKDVWKYNIDLAVEAAHMGFDEINFDYVRYSDWSDKLSTYSEKLQFSQPTDPAKDPEAMYNNIVNFMEQAHEQINRAGAFMSVDVFGRVMLGPSLPIAQDIARMAPHTDYIDPMPYPSLWWAGAWGLDNPTAHPYEVILNSLKDAAPFFKGQRAQVRPWLQDHTDPWQGSRVVVYGPKEVKAQIDAVADFDKNTGWILYDSANQYKGARGGAVK